MSGKRLYRKSDDTPDDFLHAVAFGMVGFDVINNRYTLLLILITQKHSIKYTYKEKQMAKEKVQDSTQEEKKEPQF